MLLLLISCMLQFFPRLCFVPTGKYCRLFVAVEQKLLRRRALLNKDKKLLIFPNYVMGKKHCCLYALAYVMYYRRSYEGFIPCDTIF